MIKKTNELQTNVHIITDRLETRTAYTNTKARKAFVWPPIYIATLQNFELSTANKMEQNNEMFNCEPRMKFSSSYKNETKAGKETRPRVVRRIELAQP